MSKSHNYQTKAMHAYKVRREQLKVLSRALKLQMKSGAIDAASVNDALIQLYSNEGHSEFKTFGQWKSLGKSIIKGSTAFTVWGSPQDVKDQEPEGEHDEFRYWPLCYLFSVKQVQDSPFAEKQ